MRPAKNPRIWVALPERTTRISARLKLGVSAFASICSRLLPGITVPTYVPMLICTMNVICEAGCGNEPMVPLKRMHASRYPRIWTSYPVTTHPLSRNYTSPPPLTPAISILSSFPVIVSLLQFPLTETILDRTQFYGTHRRRGDGGTL